MIDLTYTAEERPDARLRAPLVETELVEDPADVAVHVIAHPAAIALALFLRRLHANDPIRSSVIQIFAPASEHGTPGVDELQQQTVSLLSFKNLPKDVFDTQLSFNLLARYGEEAPVSLEESELRIERHLASLLALPGDGEGAPDALAAPDPGAGVSRLQLFGLGGVRGRARIWKRWKARSRIDSIEVRGGDFEPPTNVGQAGQGGIAVGAITPDRNHPEAVWLWFVADNVRLAAENAVAVARQLV